MRKNSLKKSLAIGIISMFALLSMFPGVSADDSEINIIQPSKGHWYWYNTSYSVPDTWEIRIVGPISIMIDTFDDPDISNLFFYLDNQPNHIWEEPTTPGKSVYTCPDVDLSLGWHYINVTAEDDGGVVIANDSVWVIKIIKDWWNPDSGPGGSCFLAGTKITMADNSDKKIEDIVIGDKVKSYDIATDAYIEGKVTKVYHHRAEDMGDHYLIINDNIRVTPNHLLYINGVLMLAGEAQIGDLLGGSDVAIYSIQQVFDQVPTYNFEVESTTTTGIETINMMYIAEELLAYPAKPGNLVNQVNELIAQGEASTVQSVVNLLVGGTQYQQLQEV